MRKGFRDEVASTRMNPEFLSGEASASPAVEPLIEAAHRLDARGHGSGAFSARNGLRTTTHSGAPLGLIHSADFVEIADYDPHLDRLLCLGRREPHAHAGMHHLMLRAKREVHVIAMIEGQAEGLPVAKIAQKQLDCAMNALEALRGAEAISFGRHVLVTAVSIPAAVKRVEELLG